MKFFCRSNETHEIYAGVYDRTTGVVSVVSHRAGPIDAGIMEQIGTAVREAAANGRQAQQEVGGWTVFTGKEGRKMATRGRGPYARK